MNNRNYNQSKIEINQENLKHSEQYQPFTESFAATKCEPKQNIVFIKTFKTGGSTTTNILSRYAIKHNLNIHGHVRCGNRWIYNLHCNLSNATTNLISEHISYDREFLSSIMPKDTIYVTQLRQPLSQLISWLNYHQEFDVADPAEWYNDTDLSPTRKFRRVSDIWKQLKVSMDGTEKDIEKLDKQFDMVLITEQFDLSLLLLRRKLCWDISDMLYVPLKTASYTLNKNVHNFKVTHQNESDLLNRRYEQSNPNAYKLYNHFSKTFDKLVSIAGQDVREELQFYQKLKTNVTSFCSKYAKYITHDSSNFLNVVNYSDVLNIPASRWGTARTMDPIDCAMMHLKKLVFQRISFIKEQNRSSINTNYRNRHRARWCNRLIKPVHPKYGIPLSVLTHAQAYDILDMKI